jgi:hypothetical protein
MSDIYEKLRVRLDELATGYPETESKVEIRLLERLFTEEEAELYLQLSPFLQNPKDVAKRLNRDADDAGHPDGTNGSKGPAVSKTQRQFGSLLGRTVCGWNF